MKNELLVFASSDHSLFKSLKENNLLTHNLKKDGLDPIDEKTNEIKYIFDFSIGSDEEKEKILTHLSQQFKVPIFSDLSCVHGKRMMDLFPTVKGAFAGAYLTPTNTFEGYAAEDEHFLIMESFFHLMSLKLFRVDNPGHGFTFGRTLSMIINEGFFALDDYLATEKNIDLAMKYGVNYPLGPMEWYQKIGPKPIYRLLESLHFTTGDKRYIPAHGLKEAFDKTSQD
ncbi:MAG: hypothetical protein DRQ88_00630 [Epsilonproteobacteria bacterium]|nr:MAG: hypothetical protein DRQ89_03710 [Campylobacterota bacterium]RLA68141.1 MAG: hypothetical protein DRQ88_00630 [Campylobacterota bacterium]